MKINPIIYNENLDDKIIKVLLKHFQYSIKDIKSYNELTNSEKNIISKDVFNYLTINE